MAHSIQSYKGRHAILNDVDTTVLMSLAIEVVHEKFPLLEAIALEWALEIDRYGPGVLDMKLDKFISSESVQNDFLSVLGEVAKTIEKYGSFIPAHVLNQRDIGKNVKFEHYPVGSLLKSINDLSDLMNLGKV